MIMLAECERCSRTFRRADDEGWKRLCIPCWLLTKNHQPAASDELAQHWRALVQLCHPDRHHGSELALSTTRWLLSLKTRGIT